MDGGAASRIAALCVAGDLRRVIEVGAGTGALTRALVASGAEVTAIEIDPDLVAILRERPELAGAQVVQADALGVDYAALAGAGPWCTGGNLPYNIATPLLAGWLAPGSPPARIVAMVQRDVADRLTARPNSPQYGSLTVFAQYAATVRRALALGPSAFFPQPKVASAVVVLDRRARPAVTVREPAFLLQVVRAAFAYRRKTLANSLSLALGIERARTQAALRSLAIDSEIRAEQLDLDAFGALADALGA